MATTQASGLIDSRQRRLQFLVTFTLLVFTVFCNIPVDSHASNTSGHAIIKSLTGIKKDTKKPSAYAALDTPINFVADSTNTQDNNVLDNIGRAMVSEDMANISILIRFPLDNTNTIPEDLLKKRANYIQNYLIKKYGISRSRIKTQIR